MAKQDTDIDRLHFENMLWGEGYQRIMGLDEVGRGCLAGPVVAAGVILHPDTLLDGVRDSKTLELAEREELAGLIREKALYWTVQSCSVEEIDELNILWASLRAMQKCVASEGANPDYLLVDGNRYSSDLIPHTCLVKGDDRSLTIGAASILAKVHRDDLMKELHHDYPYFGWDTNVGYPTQKHYKGLEEYGYTKWHRTGFNLRTEQPFREE